ncbi:MAG: hypothetical protein DME45_03155 [Verrucomicrobia bacterium]|nr:MAG: hypothetical protein DME45_03155 [Verrucomicrobiota bacterium]
MSVSASRRNNLSKEVRDDETSSPARETRALPNRSGVAALSLRNGIPRLPLGMTPQRFAVARTRATLGNVSPGLSL